MGKFGRHTHPHTRRLLELAQGRGLSFREIVVEDPDEDLDKIFDLSVRTLNGLLNAGIRTRSQLLALTERQLLNGSVLGRNSLNEIKDALAFVGLHLKWEHTMPEQELGDKVRGLAETLGLNPGNPDEWTPERIRQLEAQALEHLKTP